MDTVTESSQPTAEGQEVLVLDADDKVIKGLERILGEAGLIVTGTPDPARARDQIINKFFAVALCDLDTPGPGEGIAFLNFVREKAPLTKVIMMTPRRSFEAAVEASRAGAADIVLKQPDSVSYLKERVLAAATELRVTVDRGRLLEDAAEVHEEFLRRMIDLHRKMVDLEDRVLGRKADGDIEGAAPLEYIDVIVVDDDDSIFAKLSGRLSDKEGWRVREAQTGGEALDMATQTRFHVAIVKETLPDLPGSMVVKAIKGTSPDSIAMLFTPPAAFGNPGEVRMADTSRLHTLVPTFTDAEQLVAVLGDVREAFQKKARERRYLQAFRQQNFEVIRRYNDIKQRIARALERPDPAGSNSSSSKSLAGILAPKR